MTDLLDKIKECTDLPAIPAVVLQIVSLCSKVDADLDKVATLISADPAMAARILRIANSCLFARAPKVTAVRRAVVRLGLKMVRMTVLSFALIQRTRQDAPPSFDFQRFWNHALLTANSARTLCEELRYRERDEAFAVGLLQDVGVLALQRALPNEYENVLRTLSQDPTVGLYQVEQRVLGITHTEAGGFLLENWGLPPQVFVPVAHHHDPDSLQDPDDRRMGRVLNLGADIAKFFMDPAKGLTRKQNLNLAREYFNLSEERLDAVLQGVDSAVREMADLFSLDVEGLPSYVAVREKAAAELAELALEAEAARLDLTQKREQDDRRMRDLEERNLALKEQATTDGLTGVLSRAEIDQRLKSEHARAGRYGHHLALAMVDIDDFKRINDSLGHLKGDSALKSLAAFLSDTVRQTDLVGRFGGDEFLVIFIEPTGDGTTQAAERIRIGIESQSPAWLPDGSCVTASVGAVFLKNAATVPSVDKLIEAADKCLYAAKDAGRNCTRYAVL